MATPCNIIRSEVIERMARREYQDPSVLIRGTKRRYWYIRYRQKVLVGPGKIERVEKMHSLGWCDEMTRRKAERAKAEIMLTINRECYTIQSHVPFGAFLDIFQTEHFRGLKEPTRNTYRQQIETHIRPALGAKRLCDVDALELTRFFHVLEDGGIARSTRATIKGILSSVFDCARRWHYVESSPVRDAEIGGGPRRVREKRIPSRGDIELLLATVDDDMRLLIETLMYTGCRISEALGLRWRNVDLKHGRIRIVERYCRGNWDVPKSESGVRVLPLGSLVEKYRVYAGAGVAIGTRTSRADAATGTRFESVAPAPDLTVFHDADGQPYRDDWLLANYLSRTMTRLGIKFPGFGWHTFRRLALSWMSQEMTPFELREQAGHSAVSMTDQYIVPDMGSREAAVLAVQRKRMTVQ